MKYTLIRMAKKICNAGVILCLLILTGCATMENPLAHLTPGELSSLSDNRLCSVETGFLYKKSPNVAHELRRRNIKDCSEGELYCRNLGLRYGTDSYAQCRLHYEQIQVERENISHQYEVARREQEIHREHLKRKHEIARREQDMHREQHERRRQQREDERKPQEKPIIVAPLS